MRIAIASASFPARLTDDPKFPASFELAKGFVKLGHEVLVLTFCNRNDPDDQEGEVDVGGIRVFRRQQDFSTYSTFQGLSKLSVFSWQIASARDLFCSSREIVEAFNPDVVEVQDFDGLGLFFAANHSYPLVVRAYGPMSLLVRSGDMGDYPVAESELIEAMEYAPVAAADGVIAICNDIGNWWTERGKLEPGSVRVVRTPYSMPDSAPDQRVMDEKPFGTIFFWGRVEKQKGADLLVECLPEVLKEFPDTRIIVGGQETVAYGEDKPYADTMRARLRELGVSDRVEFLGFLERQKIVELVTMADLCVFPSRYETACYTCIEAMSYGGCCIGTRVGGLQEYCLHDQTGWLVEPDDSAALANGILHLARNPELRERLSKTAREHVRSFCSPDKIARESLDFYEEVIERFQKDRRSQNEFSIFVEQLGRALEDGPSRQTIEGVQVDSEAVDKAYKSGFDEGYRQASAERGMSLGGAIIHMARKAKYRLLSGRSIGNGE